jgi:hypothetical protein
MVNQNHVNQSVARADVRDSVHCRKLSHKVNLIKMSYFDGQLKAVEPTLGTRNITTYSGVRHNEDCHQKSRTPITDKSEPYTAFLS